MRSAACIGSGQSRSRSSTGGSPPTASCGQRISTNLKPTSTDGGRNERRNTSHRPCPPRRATRAPPSRPPGGGLAGSYRPRATPLLVPFGGDRERRRLGGRCRDQLPV